MPSQEDLVRIAAALGISQDAGRIGTDRFCINRKGGCGSPCS